MKTEEHVTAHETFETFEPGKRSRRRQRVRRRNRGLLIVVVAALTAGAVWGGAQILGGGGGTRGRSGVLAGADKQTAYLFMIRQAGDLSRRSDMLVVFALDRDGRNPVTLLIPSSAQTEIPGHGGDFAGRGFSFGGMPLQSLVVDNMLGIALDSDLAMSDEVMGKLVDQVGGIDLDLPGPLLASDGASAEFEGGSQHLDGEAARRFLRYQAADETELSRLARAQLVWEALIVKWGKLGIGVLAQRFRSLGREYGQGLESGISPLELSEFFTAFAAAGRDGRVYTTLPVTPVSAGDGRALRVDEAQVAGLVRQYLQGSVPNNPYRSVRIQILNGNGRPQVGEKVGLVLIPKGFRIVNNRNARTFDYQQTKIVVYSRDPLVQGAARKIRELLGVGEVEFRPPSQSLVDVTIVVGDDFNPST